MRIIFISILLFGKMLTALSQADTVSNSFELIYKKTSPSITYQYDYEKQIHDYSNNWDFDNDSLPDKIYFIGTGGAHLYYFLRVILSSDNMIRDFSFVESDLPILPAEDELKKNNFKLNGIQFAVFDYDKDNSPDIFIKLDNPSFEANKKFLKKKGISTNRIILMFKKGRTLIKDFTGNH